MSYTKSSSTPEETILYAAKESRWFILTKFLLYTVLAFLLVIAFEVWGLLVYLFWIEYLIQRWFSEYTITNRRVVMRYGIVRRVVRETGLSSIEGVDVYQSFWNRLFGIGTVTVRGRGNHVIDFVRIGGAIKFKTRLQESLDKAK